MSYEEEDGNARPDSRSILIQSTNVQSFMERYKNALFFGQSATPITFPEQPGHTVSGHITVPPPILNPQNTVPKERRHFYQLQNDEALSSFIEETAAMEEDTTYPAHLVSLVEDSMDVGDCTQVERPLPPPPHHSPYPPPPPYYDVMTLSSWKMEP